MRTGDAVACASPACDGAAAGDETDVAEEGTPAKRTTNSPNERTWSRLTVLSAVTSPSSFRTQAVDAGRSWMAICSGTAKDSTRYCMNTQLAKANSAIPEDGYRG